MSETTYSDDGNWYWDGSEWQPVDRSGATTLPEVTVEGDPSNAGTDNGGADSGGGGGGGADSGGGGGGGADSGGGGAGEQIDTSGLVATLSAIAEMDEEAVARSSSAQIDDWLAALGQWHDYLSQLPSEASDVA